MGNSSYNLFANQQTSKLLQGVTPPIIIADNLRTPENIGMILRLSANIDACLTLFIIDDEINFRESKIKRTSSGASEKVDWKIITSDVLLKYIPDDYSIVALETCDDSENIFDFSFPDKTAIMVGNEVVGIKPENLLHSDSRIFIPVPGRISSLNVTHALSIAVFQWFRQFSM